MAVPRQVITFSSLFSAWPLAQKLLAQMHNWTLWLGQHSVGLRKLTRRLVDDWYRYWGFHEWGDPKMVGLQRKIPLKWMIWGYPYFRKPPEWYLAASHQKCRMFANNQGIQYWTDWPFLMTFPVKPIYGENLAKIYWDWGFNVFSNQKIIHWSYSMTHDIFRTESIWSIWPGWKRNTMFFFNWQILTVSFATKTMENGHSNSLRSRRETKRLRILDSSRLSRCIDRPFPRFRSSQTWFSAGKQVSRLQLV